MNIPGGKQPATWQDYEQGGQDRSPSGSVGSRIQWSDENAPSPSGASSTSHNHDGGWPDLHRRRSSVALHINTLRQLGGVNSIDNFARSWQRAANFHEIAPVRPSFRFDHDVETGQSYRRSYMEGVPHTSPSLIRNALDNEERVVSGQAVPEDQSPIMVEYGTAEETPLRRQSSRIGIISSTYADSIFSVEPSLASVFGGSYGTTYASRGSHASPQGSSTRQPARIFNEERLKTASGLEQERDPLLVKQIEEDGVTFNIVVGRSTLPQTIFNSVNVLIGVGLLSLPLGLRYSGWVIGLVFFAFAVVATRYTATILAKCLDVDNSLVTFSDLAYVSFGSKARIATCLLFTVELVAACVALIILFADSLDALFPGHGIVAWKLICCLLLIPLSFLPLRLLSFTSVLGILCCLGIVVSVFMDGLVKPHRPGSLREPARTYAFPAKWETVPLAFGLLMSPWGGHSVFPNIYRDMRHPYKYRRAVDVTYTFSFLLDLGMAVIGLLMFGDEVQDEITSNILLNPGYPPALSIFLVGCIAIIPLTKVPLNARPIVSTIEVMAGLLGHSSQESSLATRAARVLVRVVTTIVFVLIAIVFPSFDRIMTLLGAVCCFSICIILPVAFHLRLFGKELGYTEKVANWVLLIASCIMGLVSTVFACLPREVLSGKP